MATTSDFALYVLEQVKDAGRIKSRKMFGEYMIYCDEKPALLVCDNIVFVKKIQETLALFKECDKNTEEGTPYTGAKPHYILDIDDGDFSTAMVRLLARVLPLPKKKNAKNRNGTVKKMVLPHLKKKQTEIKPIP